VNRFALARREAYFIPIQLELWDIPLWFLLSCMVMPLLFIVLCALMVSRLFVDLPLDPHIGQQEELTRES